MRLQKLIYQGIIWRGLYYASVFVLNILIARMYGAADSGWINYFINNLSFLLLITSLSFESALVYFASREEIDTRKLTGIGLLLSVISATVSTALFALFIYSQSNNNMPAAGMAIAFAYVLGFVLSNYFSGLYYAKQQLVLPSAILIGVNLAVIFAAAILSDKQVSDNSPEPNGDLLVVYFASFPVQGLLIAITWIVQNGLLARMQLPDRNELRKMLNYAFTALLANLIFFLVYRVDYWFVDAYCDNTALGNYIQVSKLGQIFLLLPSIIATAVFTRTAGGSQEQIRSVIEIISRWLLLFYLLFVLVIFITGKWLFPEVYGDSFDQMYAPFMLLSPGILSLSTLSLLSAFYAGRNKMGINIKGSAIAFVVIVIGNFLFIPKYGIVAAAMVSSIGYICFQVYVLHKFRKEYRSNVLAFFIPKWSDWDTVKQYIRAQAN